MKIKNKKVLIISSIVFLIALFSAGSFSFWINGGNGNSISSSVEANLFSLADIASGNGAPLSASCDAAGLAGGCHWSGGGSATCGTETCIGSYAGGLYTLNACNGTTGGDDGSWSGGYSFTHSGADHTLDHGACPFCGDGSCNNGENCSTCPGDCACVVNYMLTVNKSGNGTISSSPAGIACGADCSESYSSGTSVTLTANPDPLYYLSGWSGCNSTSGNQCTVTMNAIKTVGATFSLSPACTPNCSCASSTCSGFTCSNGCAGTCPGTKNCPPACTPNCSCASSTCSGSTCSNGCAGTCPGTKTCSDSNWREVAP